MEYAAKHGIEVPTTTKSPFSIDENLWGRSIEGGVLEDPGTEPPEEAFAWTKSLEGRARPSRRYVTDRLRGRAPGDASTARRCRRAALISKVGAVRRASTASAGST